jgi:glycine cleavage system H lipoate-binding protein
LATALLASRAARCSKTEEVSFVTAILVALTIVAFIAVDWARSRKRAARTAMVRRTLNDSWTPETFARDEGVFYGPGHTWARLEANGAVRVGIDDFARRLMGRVDRIESAPAGAALGRTDAAFVVHQGAKTAAFAPPVEGVVTSVNDRVLRDPADLEADPYGAGWLMLLEPRRLAHDLRELRIADEARTWLRGEVARVRDFVASQIPADAVGATAQDGGVPVAGVLEQMDDRAWERFESEFLAS